MMRNCYAILLIYSIISLGSCSGSTNGHEVHVINVEAAVGTGTIQNASEYIREFIYIPLETVSGSLIRYTVKDILVENDKIYILNNNLTDLAGYVTIFDMNGRHISTMNKRGRGPGEFFSTYDLDITPSGNMLIMTRSEGTFEYDDDFKFIKQLRPEKDEGVGILDGWAYDDVVVLKEGLYALNAANSSRETLVESRFFVIYDDSREIQYIEEMQRVMDDGPIRYYGWVYIQYLQDNKLSIYRPETDSIFSIDFENGYSKSLRYTFNLGKYALKKSRDEALDRQEYIDINKNSIHIKNLLETDKYIFIEFNFNDLAPEPIKNEAQSMTVAGRTVSHPVWTDGRVHGIYDKKENKLTLLNQPIPGTLGLKNDLDGGPPVFWPKYITSKKEMVTYYTALEIMDLIEQGKVDKELFGDITENDNPIIVIARERH